MDNGLANPNQAGAGRLSVHDDDGHRRRRADVAAHGARRAPVALAADAPDRAFYETKLATAHFFADRVMPETGSLRRKLEAGSESVMAIPAEAF